MWWPVETEANMASVVEFTDPAGPQDLAVRVYQLPVNPRFIGRFPSL
jgi:hypothetical protein